MGVLVEGIKKIKASSLNHEESANLNKTLSIPFEPMSAKFTSYNDSGVNMEEEQSAVTAIIDVLASTKVNREKLPGEKIMGIGNFSGVVRLSDSMGLALCTDGVGTKILIAEMMGKFDTIGIDCIAMNVNDLICVGAEPISMVDYLAMDSTDPYIAGEIAKGLKTGAELANITIAGGEIASIKDMLGGIEGKPHVDLSGMAVGLVALDKIIDSSNLCHGDTIVALESTGIHSNGLTLARDTLLKKHDIHNYIDSLQTTVGEELLRPTKIYVKEILEMLKETEIHAMMHITSHGISNLNRLGRKYGIGFSIDTLPKPQPIFDLIQKDGPVANKEMYQTFNMGMGFCIIAPDSEVDDILTIAEKHKVNAHVIGKTIEDKDAVVDIEPLNLKVYGHKVGC